MSLSKVYKSLPAFEPVGIIREKLEKELFLQDEAPSQRHQKPVSPESEKKKEEIQTDAQPQPSASEPSTPPPPEPEPEIEPEPPPPPGIPEEEVQRLVAEAREQGIEEGLQKAENDFGTATAAMLQICSQLDDLRNQILQNSVTEIRELVLAISEKIIRHSISEQQDTIYLTVDEAIKRAVKSDNFELYVNPGDYEILSEKAEDIIAGLSGLNNLIITKDPSIEAGGCRLESDKCTVDATILSQLDLIREALTEEHDE